MLRNWTLMPWLLCWNGVFILACRLMNFMLNRSNRYRLYFGSIYRQIEEERWRESDRLQSICGCRVENHNNLLWFEIKCSRCYWKLKITNQGQTHILFIYCDESKIVAINPNNIPIEKKKLFKSRICQRFNSTFLVFFFSFALKIWFSH